MINICNNCYIEIAINDDNCVKCKMLSVDKFYNENKMYFTFRQEEDFMHAIEIENFSIINKIIDKVITTRYNTIRDRLSKEVLVNGVLYDPTKDIEIIRRKHRHSKLYSVNIKSVGLNKFEFSIRNNLYDRFIESYTNFLMHNNRKNNDI